MRALRWVMAALAVGTAPSLSPAALVVERWGISGSIQHTKTVEYEEVRDMGTLMRFDLSALPGGARIHRARLFLFRSQRYASAFDIVPVERTGEGPDAKLKALGSPLELGPPHYRWFDATEAVRRWSQAGSRAGLLLIRKAPEFQRERTCVEIAYESAPKARPRQVDGVRAFCRSGQVFVTFREVEDFAGDNDAITWGELYDKRFRDIDYEGPIPRDDEREVRYHVYTHDKPITPETIGEARLLGEAVPGSGYNTRLVPGGDFIKRRPKAVALRLAVEPAEPLPPGVGVYVHTVEQDGARYYAVVSSINGVENAVDISPANAIGPIKQKRATPEPVLQREEITELRDGKKYHEQGYSFWAVPPLAPRPLRYDLAVGFCPASMSHPAPLTVTRGHTWTHTPEMPRPEARPGLVMSMSSDPPNGFWTGINDARDTLKGIEDGAWQPFTHNRQEALIRWMQKKWDVDEQRIVSAIGAWGMWEFRRPDLYAYIHGWGMPEVTKGFQCWNWARGAWGPPEAYKGKPDSENPYVLQDYTSYVLAHPEKEFPFFQIHTGWGAHFTEMGWPPFPRFVRAMIDTRQPFCMQSRAVDEAIRRGVIRFRRDQSVPAFGNCSLDNNIAEGDLKSGMPFGQVNGYLLWESATIVDEPGLWEITVWLHDSAPLDACTVDLTPRRCQKFKAKPGERFAWTNVSPETGHVTQTGRAAAGEHGLVTVRNLAVGKAKGRVRIRREKGS